MKFPTFQWFAQQSSSCWPCTVPEMSNSLSTWLISYYAARWGPLTDNAAMTEVSSGKELLLIYFHQLRCLTIVLNARGYFIFLGAYSNNPKINSWQGDLSLSLLEPYVWTPFSSLFRTIYLLPNLGQLLVTCEPMIEREGLVERRGGLFQVLAIQEDGGLLSQRPLFLFLEWLRGVTGTQEGERELSDSLVSMSRRMCPGVRFFPQWLSRTQLWGDSYVTWWKITV